MRTRVFLTLLMAGCGGGGLLSGGPDTVEEAAAYASERGVDLKFVEWDEGQIVAERSADYTAGDVKIDVLQFKDAERASAWLGIVNNMTVQHGRVVYSIWGGTQPERDRIAAALR